MAVTYTKLWHILIDKGMKKKDLQQAADLTNHTMLKLRNNIICSMSIVICFLQI